MQVFVLACGCYSRCLEKVGDRTRLNLKFGKYTLIEHVIAKAYAYGYAPIVVTDDEAVEQTISHFGVEVFRPKRTSRSYAETVLSTKSLWRDHNVFLMGDIAFTRGAYKASFADYGGECRVIGTHLEPYTLTFGKVDEKRVEEVLKEALALAQPSTKSGQPARSGKLAIFYRLWCGIDPSKNVYEVKTYIKVGGICDLDVWYDIEKCAEVLHERVEQV